MYSCIIAWCSDHLSSGERDTVCDNGEAEEAEGGHDRASSEVHAPCEQETHNVTHSDAHCCIVFLTFYTVSLIFSS